MSFTPPRRPLFKYENSNQSLSGLERAIPPTPSPGLSVGSAKSDLNKPLPPSPIGYGPRKTSSIYSQTQEEILDSYFSREDEPKEDLLPARVFEPPLANNNLSSLYPPRADLLGAHVYGGPVMYAASDSMLPLRHVQGFDPSVSRILQYGDPVHSPPSRNSTPASPTGSPLPARMGNRKPAWEREPRGHATYLAEQYRDTLPARSLTPPNFARLQFQNDLIFAGAPTSSRIISVEGSDLAVPALTPEPYSRPISPFTASSESSTNEPKPRASILRTYASKAMHRHGPPNEEQERERVMSIASMKYPAMNTTLPIKGRRRSSIQNRVGDLYETLTSISISPTRKPSNPAKHRISRDQRNPAIQLTAYQQMGTKAWEEPPVPKTPKTPKKIKFVKQTKPSESLKSPKSPKSPNSPQTPKDSGSPSSIKSLKSPRSTLSWLASRRQKASEEKMNSKREEMKKKIVVVGAANHDSLLHESVFGTEPSSEWL